jgi:protein SCO1/2
VKRFAAALALAVGLLEPGGGARAYPPANFAAAFAFRPHPGAELPLMAPLIDETGRTTPLGDFFTGKPVVVVLEYLRCKSLCGLTLANVVTALDALPFEAGRDFEMLAISIDPRDTPAETAAAKTKYLALYHHHGGEAGIHFLTGSAGSVRRIADAIGFPYRYDADTGRYVHPAGFILAAPDGRISRYILGIAAAPGELRAGLVGAQQGEALSPLTRLFLLCHIEGVPLGRFTVPVMAAFTIGDIAAGLAALVVVLVAVRRRRQG